MPFTLTWSLCEGGRSDHGDLRGVGLDSLKILWQMLIGSCKCEVEQTKEGGGMKDACQDGEGHHDDEGSNCQAFNFR